MSDDLVKKLSSYRGDLDAAIEADRRVVRPRPLRAARTVTTPRLVVAATMAILGGAIVLAIMFDRGNSPAGVAPARTTTAPLRTASTQEACAPLESRQLPNGLATGVPVGAVVLGGGGSADPGPVHSSYSVDFDVNGLRLTSGRWIDQPAAEEPDVAWRADGGAFVFVRSEDATLRDCVLAATTYDRARDLADE